MWGGFSAIHIRSRELGVWLLSSPLAVLCLRAEAERLRGGAHTRLGKGAGEVRTPPARTYGGGDGVSLFTNEVIPGDYIKAQAQQGAMGSAL